MVDVRRLSSGNNLQEYSLYTEEYLVGRGRRSDANESVVLALRTSEAIDPSLNEPIVSDTPVEAAVPKSPTSPDIVAEVGDQALAQVQRIETIEQIAQNRMAEEARRMAAEARHAA